LPFKDLQWNTLEDLSSGYLLRSRYDRGNALLGSQLGWLPFLGQLGHFLQNNLALAAYLTLLGGLTAEGYKGEFPPIRKGDALIAVPAKVVENVAQLLEMDKKILGIHHVTAIASDPQRNIDFYVGVLGLRLVKLTVNFDEPTTYHLYYGDQIGHPGTIMTFFAWPGGPNGRIGTGQSTSTSFSIPETAISFWVGRLKSRNIPFQGPSSRFNERVLSFSDPDGLRLELVATRNDWAEKVWKGGPVPTEYAVRGFHGIVLSEAALERTSTLLSETMGFRRMGEAGNRFRFEVGEGGPSTIVDVLTDRGVPRGIVSVGTVHHVAYRTSEDEQQKAWREQLIQAGMNVTPVIDRKYFHSIYYREPGGVLFEIATDPPGFTVDEAVDQLGEHLALPSWLEPRRREIEQALPPVRLPSVIRAR
jgi:glyoxalase family protein